MEDRLDRQGEPPPTRVSGAPARADLPRDTGGLPALPSAYDRALDRGLAGLRLGLTDPARAAIATHVRLLLAWNAAINLTAIDDPEAVAIRHVVDSLTALPLLRDGEDILDLGSGGGFPGLPLAAALPAAHVTLVDSVAKKGAFLEVAVAAAGLAERVTVTVARAEALAGSPRDRRRRAGPWHAVLARGVADLAELVELALPLLDMGGRLVAWKRGDLGDELRAAGRAAAVLGARVPRVHPLPAAIAGLEGHVLVEVGKLRATPVGYPRDPAVRRRRPW